MKSNLGERLGQLEEYSKTLVQALRVLDERRHILEPLLQDQELKSALAEKLRSSKGAHAYNQLVPWLAQDLVRDLSRLYLDEGKRSGSLINLYRKASEPKMFEALRKRFREIPCKWYESSGGFDDVPPELAAEMLSKMREDQCQEFEKSFDEGWKRVSDYIQKIGTDVVSEKLKTFRDKYHAHLEMSPLGQDPGPFDVSGLGLKYNDVLNFSDNYIEAAFELNRIISGTVYDSDRFSELHREYGYSMWRVLAGLEQ